MQAIINGISIDDQEQTNELRRELEQMLSTIISMNQANERNGTQWLNIQQTISQVNLDLLNLPFESFLEDTYRELERINTEIGLLVNGDFVGHLNLANRSLDIHRDRLSRANDQVKALQRAYISGRIGADAFRVASEGLTRTLGELALAARRASDEIIQIELNALNQQQASIMAMTNIQRQVIQQRIRQQVDDWNDEIAALQARQNALRDMEQALNDGLRDRNRLRDDERDRLREILALERERVRDVLDGLRRQLDAYREIIGIRRRELQRGSEDRRFEQDLDATQTELARVQNRIDELRNNDSLAARAERARLEEELARRQLDLDNLIFANDVQNIDRALQDELSRYERANAAEVDAINNALREFERAHQARLDMLDREQQAHEDMIAGQIDGLRAQSDAYDKMIEGIRDNINALQDSISRNGDLTRKAMQELSKDFEGAVQEAIRWNKRYGTGFEEDVLRPAQDFIRATEDGNVTLGERDTLLNHVSGIMQRQIQLTHEQIEAQRRLNHEIMIGAQAMQSDFQLRSFFENQGRNVDWNPNTRQFSVDGHWFDTGSFGFTNADGRHIGDAQAFIDLEREIERLRKTFENINSFDTGGRVRGNQVAFLHDQEFVLNRQSTKALDEGRFAQLKVSPVSTEAFAKLMQDAISSSAFNAAPWLNGTSNSGVNNIYGGMSPIEIHQEFHGVTAEGFMRELPATMRNVAEAVVGEYNRDFNNAAKRNGVGGRVRAVR